MWLANWIHGDRRSGVRRCWYKNNLRERATFTGTFTRYMVCHQFKRPQKTTIPSVCLVYVPVKLAPSLTIIYFMKNINVHSCGMQGTSFYYMVKVADRDVDIFGRKKGEWTTKMARKRRKKKYVFWENHWVKTFPGANKKGGGFFWEIKERAKKGKGK